MSSDGMWVVPWEGLVSNRGPAQTDFSLNPPLKPAGAVAEQLKHEMSQRTLLLASAAHEIKTPLAVINGFADFLLGEHAGPLNQQQKLVLAEMQQNTLRLQRTIQSFLNFSALQAGKFEIRKELHDLNQCVAEVIEQWQVPYTARGILCEFFPDDSIQAVCFDYLKLQNIISNLLDNALKFSPSFGQVTVTTKAEYWQESKILRLEKPRNSEPPKNNCIRIEVADNGPGISSVHHEAIFEEFRQIDKAGQSQGAGLGLAIAQKLVDAHGGKISVHSSVGEGSTFSVLLPMR